MGCKHVANLLGNFPECRFKRNQEGEIKTPDQGVCHHPHPRPHFLRRLLPNIGLSQLLALFLSCLSTACAETYVAPCYLLLPPHSFPERAHPHHFTPVTAPRM